MTLLVVPPFDGGLHCGSGTVFLTHSKAQVVPPFDGGLHCGGGWLKNAIAD